MQRGQIIEALDNLTWTCGNHSFKFGADFKRITITTITSTATTAPAGTSSTALRA